MPESVRSSFSPPPPPLPLPGQWRTWRPRSCCRPCWGPARRSPRRGTPRPGIATREGARTHAHRHGESARRRFFQVLSRGAVCAAPSYTSRGTWKERDGEGGEKQHSWSRDRQGMSVHSEGVRRVAKREGGEGMGDGGGARRRPETPSCGDASCGALCAASSSQPAAELPAAALCALPQAARPAGRAGRSRRLAGPCRACGN